MPHFRSAALSLASLTLVAWSATGQSQAVDNATLLKLNEDIFRAQIVAGDTSLFARHAVEEYRVLAPGGLIENRGQAIAGVRSWDAAGVEISGAEVVRRGPVAIVLGRIDIDGEMRPVGRWGPLKFMSVFLREGDEWRLVSRSMTPCHEMLVRVGRC